MLCFGWDERGTITKASKDALPLAKVLLGFHLRATTRSRVFGRHGVARERRWNTLRGWKNTDASHGCFSRMRKPAPLCTFCAVEKRRIRITSHKKVYRPMGKHQRLKAHERIHMGKQNPDRKGEKRDLRREIIDDWNISEEKYLKCFTSAGKRKVVRRERYVWWRQAGKTGINSSGRKIRLMTTRRKNGNNSAQRTGKERGTRGGRERGDEKHLMY